MEPTQGDPALLEMPVARRLLESQIPARLAYTALDGTPRAIPMAFHWTGEAVVFGTWHDAPKVPAIRARPAIALTIDSEDQPYNVLMIRGTAIIDIVEGVPPEYAAAVERYMGTEQGRAWVEQIGRMYSRMARLTVRPEWVGLLDFETRFPSGIARRMHRPSA